ncbi:MAG: hypothetical protein ABR502_03745 [Chitinophagaceae bacterium]
MTLVRDSVYYLGDKYNYFIPLTKQSLMKRFPKFKKQLQAWLNENNIQFNKEADVIKLFQFLTK